MKLAFNIATRFLKSSMGQTILIVIGITIGVAVQIFIGSLIDGLQVSLVDRTIGSSSQVTIANENNENYFSDNEDLMNELNKEERLTAVSKAFDASGFVIDEEDSFPVLMRGFEFEAANDIYKFTDKLVEGDMPKSEGEVLIGTELSEKVAIQVGDVIEFGLPAGGVEEVEVVGIFDLGVASLNESWMVTELETAQTLFDEEGNISSIEMQVEEVFEADVIAGDIQSDAESYELEVTNWKDENEQLLAGLSGQSISSYMIQVFVLVAVLLGIASVLAVSVVQKSKQLGILKAMGIKDKTASQIFLIQGFLLGTIGGVAGTGLGVGLMYGFSTFVKNPDGTSLVPFFLDWQFIGMSVVIAIFASTLAAFIPAKSSSRLDPMEVIKNG
ncbi:MULTISPECIES: ABC transporter permease [unclassified Jeotgalibaca]|uniref:ABC transporter permease n=1 Tax=unclassified Jeotgalibaca TaxID=2621505 RepID=UPI003FD32724